MPKMPLSAPFLPHGSGMGADPDSRVLWIFGAGASAHLHFPVSSGFLRSAIQLVTSHFRTDNELSMSLAYSSYENRVTESGGSPLPYEELLELRNNPVLAFDNEVLWDYFGIEWESVVRLQHLRRALSQLREKLSAVDYNPTTEVLLETPPETIIHELRQINPRDLYERKQGRISLDSINYALQSAIECVQNIYFYALSEFNDQARTLVSQDRDNSCYEQLVRAFMFEEQTRVISFNYDTILDESLFSHHTTSWGYDGIPVAGINGMPVSPGTEPDLRYIKPHGSLNMLYCRNCSKMHIQWFARYIPRGANTNAATNRRCSTCKFPTPGRRELMTGMVTPPLYDKEVIQGNRDAIIQAFQWANRVISVGFSFPDQDTYFRECMQTGLSSNQSSSIKIYLVLRGQAGTNNLRQKLLTAIPELRQERVEVVPTEYSGFEYL